MELILIRKYHPIATNGRIIRSGLAAIICYTIELPWLNNKHRVSCIPEGRYEIRMRYSLKYRSHMQLMDVKERELILIHPANNAVKELKGCIAPVSKLTGEGKGSRSRLAFEKLKILISTTLKEKEPVFITIKS
jgi:hypothetical protein